MLAAATGVLQLTVTVMVWGRAWTAVAAALAGAADVHWIAASLIAPAMEWFAGGTGNGWTWAFGMGCAPSGVASNMTFSSAAPAMPSASA